MKLDLDCVRKVMLAVEDKPLDDRLNIDMLQTLLPEFSEDMLIYCCLKLSEAGFIGLCTIPVTRQLYPGIKAIRELTYEGHLFLEKIRDDSLWSETKEKAKGIGSFALDVISQIAASIISSRLGL